MQAWEPSAAQVYHSFSCRLPAVGLKKIYKLSKRINFTFFEERM